ncbi:MAG: hypothetical protein RJA22_430 [Verrucomicrobiota bacterium]|jgi:sugar phosphate isomerase/epimerase
MQSAITLSLVPEARGGPFVLWDDLEAGCAKAAALGFDAVEIFPRSAEDLNAKALRGILTRHGLKLAALGTGAGWVAHRLRLTDPDPAVRGRARDFIGALVDLAGGFGAPAIVGSMQGRWEGAVDRDQALAWLAEAFEQLGPRAHAHGVPLLYECLNRYESNLCNRVAEAAAFLAPLRTRNIQLLCDLFHMNIEEASIPAALRQAGPLLGHVHFADTNRQAVGLGHLPLPPIRWALSEIGYSGYLSAEVLPLPDSQRAATQAIKAYREFAFGS